MKSKLKYYAQVIGVNLLAALVPILAVVLIYDIRLLPGGNHRGAGWFLRWSFAPWLG